MVHRMLILAACGRACLSSANNSKSLLLLQAWRILDFLVNYPESAHMLTWLLDEPGIPTDYRHQEGEPIEIADLAML